MRGEVKVLLCGNLKTKLFSFAQVQACRFQVLKIMLLFTPHMLTQMNHGWAITYQIVICGFLNNVVIQQDILQDWKV